jgi:hypothetical protein
VGAVDLELHQFVPVDAHRPGGVDLRDDPAVEFEDAVGRVVRGGVVGLAPLVPALRDVGGRQRLHGAHRCEQLAQHVLPVREHVRHDPAAVLGPVVPRRALRGLPVALEHPVAELAAHGQHPAEEPALHQAPELDQAGQEDLVLHHAVLDARGGRQPGQLQRPGERAAGRLLAVDVLARGHGRAHRLLARRGHLGVEVDLHRRVGEDGVQVRRPVLQAVPLGDGAQRLLPPADQHRLRPQHAPVAEIEPALVADRQQ